MRGVCVVVDEDENGFRLPGAAAHFDAFGDTRKDGLDARFFEEAGCEVVEECGVEPGADVGDAPFADLPGEDGGLAVEPAIAFAITFDDGCVGRLGAELFGPDAGGA